MNINTEQYERIAKFLDADMTLEEMEAFEKELASNMAMRQQLDFEQSVRNTLTPGNSKITAVTINSNENKASNETNEIPVKKIGKKRWLALTVAASFIAVMVTIVLIKTKKNIIPAVAKGNDSMGVKKNDTVLTTISKPADTSKIQDLALLYQQYFTTDSLPGNYPLYLAEAFTNYQNGDYTAIEKLSLTEVPEVRGTEDKQNILALGHYYKAIAFLKTGNPGKALTNLQWFENNNTSSALKLKAQWYQALAYLNTNSKNESVALLKKISSDSTYPRYNHKAKSLLKALQE